jgi:hypothetical protein
LRRGLDSESVICPSGAELRYLAIKEQGGLILRSGLFGRVSKDGEKSGVAAILRDTASRLLRMRAAHDAGVFHLPSGACENRAPE